MTNEKYNAIVAERITAWTGFLRKHRAIPALMVGLDDNHPKQGLHVAVPDDVDRAGIRAVLIMALTILLEGDPGDEFTAEDRLCLDFLRAAGPRRPTSPSVRRSWIEGR